MRKLKKTQQELIDYMHKEYPNDSQLFERMAMLDAYDFLVGIKDEEEKRREEIAKMISDKVSADMKSGKLPSHNNKSKLK